MILSAWRVDVVFFELEFFSSFIFLVIFSSFVVFPPSYKQNFSTTAYYMEIGVSYVELCRVMTACTIYRYFTYHLQPSFYNPFCFMIYDVALSPFLHLV